MILTYGAIQNPVVSWTKHMPKWISVIFLLRDSKWHCHIFGMIGIGKYDFNKIVITNMSY